MLGARLYLPNPEKGEAVQMVLRRHSIIVISQALLFVVLLIVPWIFRWFLQQQFPSLWTDDRLHAILFMGGSIYTLYILLFFFSSFLDYWLDVWVVTNERIINIEQNGLFSRTFSEQRLYRIQEISSQEKGFIPTIFNYGQILVQSASEKPTITFEQVPHADIVARKIMDLMEASKHNHPGE